MSHHVFTAMLTSGKPARAGDVTRGPFLNSSGMENLFDADLLQLWVHHSRQCTETSIALISAWNVNHERAIQEISTLLAGPDHYSARNGHSNVASPRIIVNRDNALFNSLHTLRAHKRRLIGRRERQKKTERLQQEQREQEQLQREKAAAQGEEQKRLQQLQRQRDEERRQLEERRVQAEEQYRKKQLEEEKIRRTSEQKAAEAVAAASLIPKGDDKFRAQYKAWMDGPSKEWVEDPTALKNGQRDLALEEITRILTNFSSLQAAADLFRQDASMKRPRLIMKKTINKAVNQISCTVSQVLWIIHQLSNVFQEVRTLNHSNARSFALHEISSRLVTEADSTVANNLDFAFGVGAIIVGVTANAENVLEMRDVMLGAFYHHFPFTRPHFPSRKKGEDQNAFRFRMGYLDEEKEEEYSRRVRGCMNLFGAVFQTELSSLKTQFPVPDNPFTLDYAWTWLARIVNRRQKTLAPDVVNAFLETAGYRMSQVYKSQFSKLVQSMRIAMLTHASPYASRLSLTNLEVWIDEFEKNGCQVIQPPSGRNLPMRDVVNT